MPSDNPNPAPAPDTATAWTNGLDPELLGVAQTRGWHDKPADQVAREVLKSYREAERHIGAPPDQILRLPREGDDAAAAAFWERLGAPKDAAGYDFKDVKFSDGSELDPGFVEHLRKTAAELRLPAATAQRVADSFVKFLEGADTSASSEVTARVQEEQAALAKEWGANAEAFRFIAKQAAAAAGVSDEEFNALASTPGGAKMLKIFQFFGSKMGEDKFITAGGVGNNKLLTREQAIARKNELMADQAWVKRYLDGGTAENREMKALLIQITGESGVDYAA